MKLRTVHTTRYVVPLREGGSMPAVVEADDEGTYVLKFRGAGQGHKALIAELLVGEIGRFLGLPVPEIVFIELDAVLGRNEPDYEIRSLIKASDGLNLALDYLPGSISFDPLIPRPVLSPQLASQIVWLDAYTTNIDRTARNTNLLVWHKNLWLIDHGAALYFHHSWDSALERSQAPFAPIREHVLLPFAEALDEADALFAPRLTRAVLTEIVGLIPAAWLDDVELFPSVEAHREGYVNWLASRLEKPRQFLEEAKHARSLLV